jgi:hypothetical protein
VYNGVCSNMLTCPAERSQSPMYMPTWMSERGSSEELEPCRSTAVGAVGTLLTSPCFRRGLRTAVIMGACGVPSLLVYRGELDGTPVLFPVA